MEKQAIGPFVGSILGAVGGAVGGASLASKLKLSPAKALALEAGLGATGYNIGDVLGKGVFKKKKKEDIEKVSSCVYEGFVVRMREVL